MHKTVVIAIGGNSLIKSGEEGTLQEQFLNAYETCKHILQLIKDGFKVVITHGNGPQVGNILFRVENTRALTYDIPLDYCGAMSQGELGYLIQNALEKVLDEENIQRKIVSVITRTLVSKEDTAFQNPTKPIGKFYTKEEAEEITVKYGFIMKEDSGRGYRQVVASPVPVEILEYKSIKDLIDADNIVIACGGGGIPVVKDEIGQIQGVSAVIDKDMTSSLLSSELKADIFVISTGVKNAYINFGKENQEALGEISLEEAIKHLNNNEFKDGSMKPKIIAAINFLKSGGKRVIITSPDFISKAIADNKTGTQIII